MRVRSWLLATAGLLLAGGVRANAQISLSAAVDLALHNDPRVKMAQADVQKAKYSLAQTKDAYIPSADINGGYGTSAGVPLSVPVVFSIASQSLLFNFSQRDNVRAAEQGLKSANLALKEMNEKVAEDVVTTYVNLDYAQRHQKLLTEEMSHASRLVTIVNDRLEGGQDTKLQLIDAKLAAAQLHLDQLHTDEDVAGLAEHLLLLTGLPAGTIDTVSSSIPALPLPGEVDPRVGESYGIQAAEANAQSKQEYAFGEARHKWRPEFGFGASYSRISTSHTSYPVYYPGFAGNNHLSDNALSIGIQVKIPLFDFAHDDAARAAMADATHARMEAKDLRNQFVEGRFKLRQSVDELSARVEVAELSTEKAEAQLDSVLAQLSAAGADPNRPQMTPEDEQNGRLQVNAKQIDALNAQQQLDQIKVNLMRQTGMLDDWLAGAVKASASVASAPTKP